MSFEKNFIIYNLLNQPAMSDKKLYKSICISDIGKDILVFHLGQSKLDGEELLIIGLAQFIELVEYKRPSYVIFNKKDTQINNLDTLQDYLKHNGIDELIGAGVKKIYFIVSEARFKELNSKVGYRGIEAFTDFEECLEEIKRQKE